MPFETGRAAPRRIAVIGAGISGLGAAQMLAGTHRVVLFEAEGRLGGHARTVMAGRRGDQPVDTGFIVFNYVNYPHLARLFADLDVPVAPSRMSFSASIGGGRFEYALNDLNSVFGQRRNLVDPRYWAMLRDILRFNAQAVEAAREPGLTVGGLIARLGLGAWFRDFYLLPFSGAIWSTPKEGILDFPAWAMVRFFENHALLGYQGQHQWHTVRGGSVEYVRRLGEALDRRGVDIRTGTPVDAVRRTSEGVEVKARGGEWEGFDEVVFATHSDQTLAMLADATEVERTALSAIRYQPNEVVLHSDPAMMPARRRCWASWNYTEAAGKISDRIDLTYWMNSLQPIPLDDPLFVTLNSTRAIREEADPRRGDLPPSGLRHGALAAQETVRAINGQNATWFCGAWMKNGFHEDGLSSAVDVVEAMRSADALGVAAE
jgi:uncharacterized protein